jgi:hypothetical protein
MPIAHGLKMSKNLRSSPIGAKPRTSDRPTQKPRRRRGFCCADAGAGEGGFPQPLQPPAGILPQGAYICQRSTRGGIKSPARERGFFVLGARRHPLFHQLKSERLVVCIKHQGKEVILAEIAQVIPDCVATTENFVNLVPAKRHLAELTTFVGDPCSIGYGIHTRIIRQLPKLVKTLVAGFRRLNG